MKISKAKFESFRKWPHFDASDVSAVGKILLSGKINRWTGNKNIEFESKMAEFAGVKRAIAVSNGTSALELALVGVGMRPGDEVIVPCRTFMASASCVAVRGGIPVVADVDIDSQDISIDSIKKLLTKRTRGIIAVHLMGWPCDMDPIMKFARANNLWVIEDCAQAHGAKYKGRPVGGIGDVGAWSFCQDKIITTGGEGGAVTVNDEAAYRRMWAYKDHGRDYEKVYFAKHPDGFKWFLESFGTNFRMTEMQAELGIRGLSKLEKWSRIRASNADSWRKVLEKFPCVRVPDIPKDIVHANYKFFFFTRPELLKRGWSAARIIREMNARGIPAFSGTCWNISQEGCFKRSGLSKSEKELPNAAALRDTSVMLLIHPTITKSDMEAAGKELEKILSQAQK